jgi:hypothetical protein
VALPKHAEIAVRAYHIWEEEGRPHGRDFDHWLKAEQEIAGRGSRRPARATSGRAKASKPKPATTRIRKTH